MSNNSNSLRDFYGETEISIEQRRQKYKNILAILNIKFEESKKIIKRVKKVHKHLTEKKPSTIKEDVEEIKELLKELKSDIRSTEKLDSKNDALKAELDEINKEYSKNQFNDKSIGLPKDLKNKSKKIESTKRSPHTIIIKGHRTS